MTIFAIDPSNIHSSYVIWNGREILGKSDKVTLNGKEFRHRFPNPVIKQKIYRMWFNGEKNGRFDG